MPGICIAVDRGVRSLIVIVIALLAAGPALAAEPAAPGRAPTVQVDDADTPPTFAPAPFIAPSVAGAPTRRNSFEPGRIVIESLAGFTTATLSIILLASPGGWPILFGPIATGVVVCGIGSGSDYFDGSCLAAMGGAYLGSLVAFPMAAWFNAKDHGSSNDAFAVALAGALIGYVLGSSAGAVVGWNVSRHAKRRDRADGARLEAVAATRALAWTEPLRPRGSLLAGAPPPPSMPLLALRF